MKKTEVTGKATGDEQVKHWLGQIEASEKREEKWLERSGKIVALYEGEKAEQSPFNILYSNTDTLMPALYSNTPRSQVSRRFKDADPLAAASCTALTRIIDYSLDSNEASEPEFDELANQAILEALVPGRGVIRWKYDAKVEEFPAVMKPKGDLEEAASNVSEEGDDVQMVTPPPKVSNERVCGEYVPYNRVLFGYAKKWKNVPWVDFIHDMTKAEVEENFGSAVAEATIYTPCEDGDKVNENAKDERSLVRVHEIWDKDSKSIYFISAGYKQAAMKCVPDPLKLSGFFPMEEPLVFQRKISTMVPTVPYDIYASQADELNEITLRITAMVRMCKVRGIYDQTIEGLDKVLEADDGILIPAQNVASLQQGQKLENALWLMPLAEIVSVLQQLLLQRTNIKQVIYEITGISDILRGSTQASETATAQSIKNQWGTLRLKKMQKLVAKWVRNNLRIIGEIAGKKFSVETFQKITGLPYVTQAVMNQAKMQVQMLQQQAAQAQMMAPPGQPAPQLPPPPPQLLETLATPVWEAVVELLRDLDSRSFRVDIETNSTIADDMAEDQKNIGELLNALSQYLNGVTPLITAGVMPFEAAKSMMLAIVRRMSFGPEIEKQVEQMKAPTPPQPEQQQPDPNIQLKSQAEAAKLQGDMQRMKMEMEFAQEEHAMKLQEMKQKMALNAHNHNMKMQAATFKAQQVMNKPAATEGAE